MDGYGLYYACVEMIAGDIATDDLTFELKHDAELIAHKFKLDTIRVEKIMLRCIELGLFDLADSGRLRCMRLAQMLDETTSRNPEMCKLMQAFHNSGVYREKFGSDSGANRETLGADKTRQDKKRIDKKRIDDTYSSSFAAFWELYDKKIDRTKCEKLWAKINPEAHALILTHIQDYIKATPDKQYRKNPETYLRNQSWSNEIIIRGRDNTRPEMTEEEYAAHLQEQVRKNEELFQ